MATCKYCGRNDLYEMALECPHCNGGDPLGILEDDLAKIKGMMSKNMAVDRDNLDVFSKEE